MESLSCTFSFACAGNVSLVNEDHGGKYRKRSRRRHNDLIFTKMRNMFTLLRYALQREVGSQVEWEQNIPRQMLRHWRGLVLVLAYRYVCREFNIGAVAITCTYPGSDIVVHGIYLESI
jgi:hypothetical protein